MGLRGPVRDPDSRRGTRERKAAHEIEDPQVAQDVQVTFPQDLGTVQEIFDEVTRQLMAANVPLRQVDAYAIKLVATTELAIRKLDTVIEAPDQDHKVLTSAITGQALLCRDQMRYLEKICATPGARIRIVKPAPKKSDNPSLKALSELVKP